MLPKKGPVWTGQRNARRGPRHNYTQVLASCTPFENYMHYLWTQAPYYAQVYMAFLQHKILLRSALPCSNSLMSSSSIKQDVLSRISMFTNQQNTTVCAVWSNKHSSARLDAANKLITNETKRFLELFKSSWERFVSVHMPFLHISSG